MSLDKICKQAITIHLYISEIQQKEYEPPYYRVTGRHTKMVLKACRKFLNRFKESKYYNKKDHYGTSYYELIKEHMRRERSTISGGYESYSLFLTKLQMWFHHFIRDFQPDYVTNFGKVKNAKFYKRELEELLR